MESPKTRTTWLPSVPPHLLRGPQRKQWTIHIPCWQRMWWTPRCRKGHRKNPPSLASIDSAYQESLRNKKPCNHVQDTEEVIEISLKRRVYWRGPCSLL